MRRCSGALKKATAIIPIVFVQVIVSVRDWLCRELGAAGRQHDRVTRLNWQRDKSAFR
jgi:hypothetical protein